MTVAVINFDDALSATYGSISSGETAHLSDRQMMDASGGGASTIGPFMPLNSANLTTAIVDSIDDDAAFADLTRHIAAFGKTASAQVQIHSTAGAKTISSFGIHDFLIERYNAYYWQHDLWAKEFVASANTTIATSDSYISDTEFARSEIYNDLMRPHDDYFRALGAVLDIGAGETFVFGMHRTRTQPVFEPEIIRAMTLIHPQIVHLVKARKRLAMGRGRFAEKIMDDDLDAVFVVSKDSSVGYMNRAATDLLRSAALLRISNNKLTCQSLEHGASLSRAIHQACSGRGGKAWISFTAKPRTGSTSTP